VSATTTLMLFSTACGSQRRVGQPRVIDFLLGSLRPAAFMLECRQAQTAAAAHERPCIAGSMIPSSWLLALLPRDAPASFSSRYALGLTTEALTRALGGPHVLATGWCCCVSIVDETDSSCWQVKAGRQD
jgi:hypothetical protein